ncbi:MAG: enoyl-CoA hydratase-related protein [Actinomycetota bacterium]
MAKVKVDERGPITIVTLNRPEVHNCVDAETADLLTEAFEAFSSSSDARVLVVTGTGSRAFCSGADLKAAGELVTRPDARRTGPMGFAHIVTDKPSIAAIEGYCFAGGLELAAWADVRIAGRTAEFGALNRRWGVPFVDGGTQRLPRIVGLGHALYLILSGARLDAEQALRMGLVDEIVDAGRALDRALELAEAIEAYPQASLRADRRSALEALGRPLLEGLGAEIERGYESLGDPALAEGLARFGAGERPESPRPGG